MSTDVTQAESEGACVCFSKCVQVCFKGFSKAPHSPDKFCRFIFFSFTKTEEVVHDLTQPAP